VDFVESKAAKGIPVRISSHGPVIDYPTAIRETCISLQPGMSELLRARALAFGRPAASGAAVLKAWKDVARSVSPGRVRTAPPALSRGDRALKEFFAKQRRAKPGSKRANGLFLGPQESLYRRAVHYYAGLYEGKQEEPARVCAHPFGDFRKGIINDPVLMYPRFKLSEREYRELPKAWREGRHLHGVSWKTLRSKPWARRLYDAGAIVPTR
jgi:hypothetical protein